MEAITTLYIFNAVLLLLHEIESAFEKEWEILKLPGGITGFLLVHIPIVLVLFYGAVAIEGLSLQGMVLGVTFGFCGLLPFLIHKIIVRKKEHFNLPISNIIIYSNTITGTLLMILSLHLISNF